MIHRLFGAVLALVISAGLAVPLPAFASPDIEDSAVVPQPDGAFTVTKHVAIYFEGNPDDPFPGDGDATYVYTVTNDAGSFVDINSFLLDINAACPIDSLGFFPGPSDPDSFGLFPPGDPDGTVRWNFNPPAEIMPGETSSELYVTSPCGPGMMPDTLVSFGGEFGFDANGLCLGPTVPESGCDLQVDKTCCIPPPPQAPGNFVCSDAKPIQTLTLTWNGAQTINLLSESGQAINGILPGQEVTLNVDGLGNDVDVQITYPDNSTGNSRFHVSCSDADMNGPEDCNTAQGNSKDNKPEYVNDWLLEGMAGSDLSFTCTDPMEFQTETHCQETGGSTGVDCQGKVTNLVFEYTGAECQAQLPEGAKCEGSPGPGTVSIVPNKDENKVEVSPTSVMVGDTFSYGPSAADSHGDLGKDIEFFVGGQKIKIHTSCSKPLNVGMEFGSVRLIEITTTEAGTITNEITPVQFLESCELVTPPGPHCTDKVKSVTFRYNGGDCLITNTQDGKATCTGPALSGDIDVTITQDPTKVEASPNMDISEGSLFTIGASAGDSNGELGSTIMFDATDGSGTQSLSIHTSCSQPLNLGDMFGPFEVVALDIKGVGVVSVGGLVEYQYTITNPTPPNMDPVTITSVDDDTVTVPLPNDPIVLVPGESRTLFAQTTLVETTTNTVTVNGVGTADGMTLCTEASDMATVSVVPPPPPAPEDFVCSDAKPIQTLTLVWDGPDDTDVVSEGGQVFTVNNGEEVTLMVGGLGNDVDVALTFADDTTGASRFHVSCSDNEMNGFEDCDKYEGNSKDDQAGLVNLWIFRGMAGDTSLVCP